MHTVLERTKEHRTGRNLLPDPLAFLFDIKNLRTWLMEQPADKEYVYADPNSCLYAQYFAAVGYPHAQWKLPGGMDGPWFDIAHQVPHTFGAAAARAR